MYIVLICAGDHAKVGKCAFLGASSCIMPNTRMGNYSKLSACSVLYKNIVYHNKIISPREYTI